MKKIFSAGKSFRQGWNDSLASPDEKPAMNSAFTYDYWLDTTEVAQKIFFEVTGRRPVPDSTQFGAGDAIPVYNVSWFDAILYCNARSKAEKLDTVYGYAGQKAFPNGNVYELTGFNADLSKDGYRLPTEAEWEFAARGGSSALPYSSPSDSTRAQADAWYAGNSGGRVHPVAEKLPNALGFYDMAGNVFEWTNDWKGVYDGNAISNALGASQPDNAYEKVIKGGAFSYGFSFLRPSIRSATYETSLSSACSYVGFRCARGSIPNGRYIDIKQSGFIPNPVTIVADADALRGFLGSFECKIVFINVTDQNRTLCSVDFGKPIPFVREYLDDKNVNTPTISPDGRFVAYCSGREGFGGPSKITIRSLDSLGAAPVRLASDTAYVPRWWVDPYASDTCIVYATSAVANSSPLWKSTKTFRQKIAGGKPTENPVEITADGGYHDGLSADGQYLISSFDRLLMRNLQTGAESQLFLSPANGKDASGSTQVCNASLSPDADKNVRCLFLDFGSPTPSLLTGCSYGIHQYLFIANLAANYLGGPGVVTQVIRCPANEHEWDYPEWSNNPHVAIASGCNAAGQAHAAYLIKIDDGTQLRIVSGTELQNPFCWVGAVAPFDSLGLYGMPFIGQHQQEAAFKLHLFWKMCDRLEAIFFGNSLVYDGVDCSQIRNLSALNMGYTNCGIYATTQFVQNYVFPHAPKVQLVGINAPFYLLHSMTGDAESWEQILGGSIGYKYDKNHNFWKDASSSGLIDSLRKAAFPNLQPYGWDSLGELHLPCNGWGGSNPVIDGPIDWNTSDPNYNRNWPMFTALIDSLAAHRIHVLAINFPENPAYKNTVAFLRGGPTWEVAREISDSLRKLETNRPFFHYYDAYLDGNHDFANEEFYNSNHLCPAGAQKLSARIDSVIQRILSR